MVDTPAGWYPQADGQQRYWDGEKWTEHFAPGAGQTAPVGDTAPLAVPVQGASAVPSPARPWFKKKRFLIPSGLVALVIAGTALSGGGDSPEVAVVDASSTPTASADAATTTAPPKAASPTVQPTKTAEAPKPEPVSFSGDGIYEVGKDIKPGLYRSAGGDGYWERLKDASGEFDSIIANGNPSGQAYVQIKKTDGYFSTNNMEDWVLVNPKEKGALATSFSGDGMYMVGVDIKPGTYKAAGEGYWERLKSASGGFDAIIANGNPSGSAIVKIKKTDKFFSTSGMEQWTRTG